MPDDEPPSEGGPLSPETLAVLDEWENLPFFERNYSKTDFRMPIDVRRERAWIKVLEAGKRIPKAKMLSFPPPLRAVIEAWRDAIAEERKEARAARAARRKRRRDELLAEMATPKPPPEPKPVPPVKMASPTSIRLAAQAAFRRQQREEAEAAKLMKQRWQKGKLS